MRETDTARRRFIRLSEVRNRVPLSKATLYRKIREKTFPKPYPMDGNGRTVAWLESDIEAWIAQRIAAAESKSPESSMPTKMSLGSHCAACGAC